MRDGREERVCRVVYRPVGSRQPGVVVLDDVTVEDDCRSDGGEVPISTAEPRINDHIRTARCRLIGVDGSQMGIFNTADALRVADEQGLDLVEIAPNSDPPVCRIMDYGKYKYEQAMKAKRARKHQTTIHIKEIKFRPKIDKHDYETKKRHVVRFLEGGNKVKVTIMFRGREMVHAERGLAILERLSGEVAELAVIENEPKLEGRNMTMLMAPVKKEVKPDVNSDAEAGPGDDGNEADADVTPVEGQEES